MGKVKYLQPSFQDSNCYGVLDHQGIMKVAKTEIRATILNINTDKNGRITDVLVKGNKGSYVAQIHQGIRKMMLFVEEGDCAFIKWKRGQAWLVGFQKQKAYRQEKLQDRYIDEDDNCNWNEFFKGVDVE